MEFSEQEQAVSDFEQRLEKLRGLYEQYFSGIEKREPLRQRDSLDRQIKRLRRIQIRNTGLRFKFNQLVARYNTYATRWQRVVRQIEAGTYKRELQRLARRMGADASSGKLSAEALANESDDPYAEEDEPEAQPVYELSLDDDDDNTAPFDREELERAAAQALETKPPPVPKAPPPVPKSPPPVPAAAKRTPAADVPATMPSRIPPPLPTSRPDPAAQVEVADAPAPSKAPPRPTSKRPPPAPLALDDDDDLFAGLDMSSPGPSRPPPPSRSAPPQKPRSAVRASASRAAPSSSKRGPARSKPRPEAASAATSAQPSTRRSSLGGGLAGSSLGGERAAERKEKQAPASRARRSSLAGSNPLAPKSSPKPAAAGGPKSGPRSAPSRAPEPAAAAKPRRRSGLTGSSLAGSSPFSGGGSSSSRAKAAAASRAKPAPASRTKPSAAEPKRAAAKPAGRSDELSDARIKQIYRNYVDAKRKCNESTASITLEKVKKSLRASAKKTRAKHKNKDVDFDVVIKNGKAVLKQVVKGK